jgi:hypothetical protein
MNSKIIGILLLLISQLNFTQTASTYFPSQVGYKWNYESVPLDSLNNPVSSQKFFSIDSFAVVSSFNGKNANVVLSKTGPQSTINFQPYLDTLYFSFGSSNGFEYFDPALVSGLLGNIDTTLGINFLNIFSSLEGWYSYYKFAYNVDVSYQIFSKDTTVTINSIELPIRFQLIGKRLADETINTAIGTFECKKFLLERKLSYLVWFFPYPEPLPVPILSVVETVWLAPENWKVKSYVPSTNVDLFVFGIPAFNISGLETNIITPITDVQDEFLAINNFELYQNYPNPFNPSTTIRYSIPDVISTEERNLNVVLKVFDILGNEVATLVNEVKPAGNYEIKFQPESKIKSPASGTYFYQLQVGNLVQSRKMLMIK